MPTRVFIASSSDMRAERERASQVIERLQEEARGRDPFVAYLYEEQGRAWNAALGWQAQIPPPDRETCEVFVSLFGERLGAPIPEGDPLPPEFEVPDGVVFPCLDEEAVYGEGGLDGDVPLTGTLFEHFYALQAARRSQASAPDGAPSRTRPFLLTFIRGDASVEQVGAPPHAREWGMGMQLDALHAEHGRRLPPGVAQRYDRQTAFLSRFFDRFLGARAPYELFPDPDAFADLLEDRLREVLGLERPTWTGGNPFKRLEHYDTSEAPIFCGRDEHVRRMVDELAQADAQAHRAPVLVLKGESGRGKSSVLHAGLGAVLHSGRKQSTTRARFRAPCVVTPADLRADDPFIGLIARLAADDVLPALQLDLDLLRDAPRERRVDHAVDRIRRALDGAADGAVADGPETHPTKLFLAVDQFEEALAEESAGWDGVLRLAVALARAGLAYVAFGLKQDWEVTFDRWVEAAGVGSPNDFVPHRLDPPDWDAVIEDPLGRCGLAVGHDLRDHLERQVEQYEGSLPLLSATLHRIYEAREARVREYEQTAAGSLAPPPPVPKTLTLADYAGVADLGSSIQQLGDEALHLARTELDDPRASDTLARVLRHLVRFSAESPDQVTVRDCPADEMAPETASLVEALKQTRLVTERGGSLKLVHESVLRHWRAAAEWLEEEKEHIEIYADLLVHLKAWRADPTPENTRYIYPDTIDAAERMLVAWRDETLDPDVVRLVKAAMRGRFDRGEHQRADGMPRLIDAITVEDEALVAHMLAEGADANAPTPVVKENEGLPTGGTPPISIAAHVGSEAIVRLLLDHGADVEQVNVRGNDAVAAAAYYGHAHLVRLLHEDHGASVDRANDEGVTPLLWAANEGHDKVVDLLLGYGVDPDRVYDGGWMPLIAAAQAGHSTVVETLLGSGASPTVARPNGWTSLIGAAHNGHVEVVRMLLDALPDATRPEAINAVYEQGGRGSALHEAAQRGHAEVVRALLDAGADPDLQDGAGRTPLHRAVREGKAGVVAALLEHQARTDVFDDNRRSPLWEALDRGAPDVLARLAATTDFVPFWYAWDPEANTGPLRLGGARLRERVEAAWKYEEPDAAQLPPPLVEGDWASVEATEAVARLTAALGHVPAALGVGVRRIGPVRSCSLPFYPDATLVEARVERADRSGGVLAFVEHADGVTWLDGTSLPIHQELNAHLGVLLDTPEQVRSYLSWFCSAIQGRHGSFTVLESPDQIRWLDSVSPADRRACLGAFMPVQVRREDTSKGWSATTTVLYEQALFITKMEVDPAGAVLMVEDMPVAAQLDHLAEAVQDGVRVAEPVRSGPAVQFAWVVKQEDSSLPTASLAVFPDAEGDRPTIPLVPGDWEALSTEDAASLLAAVPLTLVALAEVDHVDAVRRLPLPIYPGAHLVEARAWRGGQVAGILTCINRPEGSVWLGRGYPLALRALGPPRLGSEADARLALRLFCGSTPAEHGTFRLVESPDEVLWLPEAADDERARAAAHARPLAIQPKDDGDWTAQATVAYAQGLFEASFRLLPSGQAAMLDDTELEDDLPLWLEVIDRGLRTLRRPPEDAEKGPSG